MHVRRTSLRILVAYLAILLVVGLIGSVTTPSVATADSGGGGFPPPDSIPGGDQSAPEGSNGENTQTADDISILGLLWIVITTAL